MIDWTYTINSVPEEPINKEPHYLVLGKRLIQPLYLFIGKYQSDPTMEDKIIVGCYNNNNWFDLNGIKIINVTRWSIINT